MTYILVFAISFEPINRFIYAYKWMCFHEQCDQMYFRNLCDRVHFCNRCDQMHFHDRCQKDVFLHTSGHTKFVICNDFDRWHCSLVIITIIPLTTPRTNGDYLLRPRTRYKKSKDLPWKETKWFTK